MNNFGASGWKFTVRNYVRQLAKPNSDRNFWFVNTLLLKWIKKTVYKDIFLTFTKKFYKYT